MTITETALVFVGVPLLVIAIVAGLIFAGGRGQSKRYRPGRPYDYAPVWFTAAPHSTTDEHGHERAVIEAGAHAQVPSVTGGASDRW